MFPTQPPKCINWLGGIVSTAEKPAAASDWRNVFHQRCDWLKEGQEVVPQNWRKTFEFTNALRTGWAIHIHALAWIRCAFTAEKAVVKLGKKCCVKCCEEMLCLVSFTSAFKKQKQKTIQCKSLEMMATLLNAQWSLNMFTMFTMEVKQSKNCWNKIFICIFYKFWLKISPYFIVHLHLFPHLFIYLLILLFLLLMDWFLSPNTNEGGVQT